MTSKNSSGATDKLSALLNHYDDSLNRKEQRVAQAKSAEQQFVDKFIKVQETVIKPTFERLKAAVEARGHSVDIRAREPGFDRDKELPIHPSISFSVAMKSTKTANPRARGDQHPSISFHCHASGQTIGCHTSTIGDGHGGRSGGSGTYTLPNFSETVIETEFVKWFEELVRDAASR